MKRAPQKQNLKGEKKKGNLGTKGVVGHEVKWPKKKKFEEKKNQKKEA